MATIKEKEHFCQQVFLSEKIYWHLFTPGKQTSLVFQTSEDYVYAMNVLAQSALQFPQVKIITFVLMSNHVHWLAAGAKDDVLSCFAFFRKRLARGFVDCGRDNLPSAFSARLKEVPDLNAARNVIAYINRNGYVANPSYTPFSYPWGACGYFFNRRVSGVGLDMLNRDARRKMFRGRAPKIPIDWCMIDGYIAPPCYCYLDAGMSMFRDAHHYFSILGKNVEAYSGVAVEIDDGEFLTDNELFEKLVKIVKERYGEQATVRNLSSAQKLDLARSLHYDYCSSNGQIRRLLGLTQYEVNSLFPFGTV